MPYKRANTELKVGIFVVFGLLIFVVFVFYISDFNFIKKGYTIKAVFGFANGVKENSPVRFAGVDMGEVKSLTVKTDLTKDKKTIVEMVIWLKENAQVPKDSTLVVNTLGLLGEKYVEIFPGTDYANILKEGDTIRGEDPVSMHAVGKTMQDISVQIKEELAGLKAITDQIKSGQGTLGKLLYDDTIYKNFEELTEDLKKHPWKLFWKGKEEPRPAKK